MMRQVLRLCQAPLMRRAGCGGLRRWSSDDAAGLEVILGFVESAVGGGRYEGSGMRCGGGVRQAAGSVWHCSSGGVRRRAAAGFG